MAWPPHEDETLALFVGRDSLPGVVEHVTRDRGGAPLHFLVAWAVAHLGFGLGGLRLASAAFALASLPLVALLGRRLAGPAVALVATALFASSWLFLFHGVYGRMYSLFLFCSLACTLALLEALERGGRARWALWVLAALLTVATHPYGVLLLGGQAAYVLAMRRDRLRDGGARRDAPCSCSASRSGSPTSSSPTGSTSGVGGGGEKLGGPGARRAVPLALGGGRERRLVARDAGCRASRPRPASSSSRREARALVLCLVGVTVAAFVLARLGGSASPESRHLIFLAPLFAIARRRRRSSASAAGARLLAAVARWPRSSSSTSRGPGTGRRRSSSGSRTRDRQRAPRRRRWLAATSRPDDVLFGYEPLYLGAWERNRSFPTTVVPRADARLALRTIERAGRARSRRLGARCERAEQHPPAARDRVSAADPAGAVRGTGVRAVPRHPDGRAGASRRKAFLYDAARALLVGQQLGIGDADVNLQTVVLAERERRGYGPSLRSRSSNSR